MTTAAATWTPDGRGVLAGGDVGGDHQSTEAFSVRYTWQRPDGLYALTTVYTYGERSGRQHRITTLTETMVCRDLNDPGGTEVWCATASPAT
ncbi:hypothetical protein AB0B89_36130, partial [Sphaerisporangium sp. NPDC049002]|uniref:hypothetical protein n=1 Tax=Sphaerisporangium sp. NPDC049002 TaxID=3155392 RepID=UPI0033DF5703